MQKLANIECRLQTLYWHNTGPLLQYDGECLYIEDLNPEVKTKWHMSRWEMIRTGLRFIAAARLSKPPGAAKGIETMGSGGQT